MTLAEWFESHPKLKNEWDTEANAKENIFPEKVTHGVKKKAWWRCAAGHSWQATIDSRTRNVETRHCPYCDHKKVVVGFTDLTTVNPELAKSWDYEKNNGLIPQEVMPGSNRKVWWKCEEGHSWQATIRGRHQGRGCPYCANLKILEGYNDFATVHPELMHRWDYEKNELDPTKISGTAHQWAWWKCEQGHSWQTRIDTMVGVGTETSGCPYCDGKMILKGYNDLLFLRPEIAKEWCYELNDCGPDEVTVGCKKKVWWKCELGHTWQIPVYARTAKFKSNCPYCGGKKVLEGFNDLKTVNPRVASEWCDRLNGDLKPTQVTKGSHKRVWWECGAGHVWEAFVYVRAKANGTGCPVCAGTVKQKFDE